MYSVNHFSQWRRWAAVVSGVISVGSWVAAMAERVKGGGGRRSGPRPARQGTRCEPILYAA